MQAFAVLADEKRQTILEMLAEGERNVGELTRRCAISQPAVSRHLHLLREGGFVRSRVAGQQRLYRLHPEGFQQVERWLDGYRAFWTARLDALDAHLDAHPAPPGTRSDGDAADTKE
jgi:DNA-binding transcriptional ArsR family regulator